MIVTLSNFNAGYTDLTPQQPYRVIGIEADDVRLLSDEGRPYLYPTQIFTVLDPTEPADWVVEIGENGERYAYPPELDPPGFFEDFFDADPIAVSTFWRVINQTMAVMA